MPQSHVLRLILILGLLLTLRLQGLSQVVTSIREYTTGEGLSDNRITCILKDKDGFMWFGSWAGITRFDGVTFVTYKSYPGDRSSLESNRIDEILEDSSNQHLWLKAYDKRIYRFDKRTQEIESLSKILNQPALSKISFSRISLGTNSQVWLLSENSGVYLISNSSKDKPQLTVFSEDRSSQYNIPSNTVNLFQVDKTGSAWVGTKKGLVYLKKESDGKLLAIRMQSGRHQTIASLVTMKDKTWLLSDRGQVIGVDSKLKKMNEINFPSLPNKIIGSKKAELLFCTTANGELYSITASGTPILRFKSRNAAPISQIFEDSQGILWIESAYSAVIRFDPKNKTSRYLFTEKQYAYNPRVTNYPMFEDKDSRVWINVDKQLYVYQSASQKVRSLSELLGDRFQKLPENITRTYNDPAGVLWVSSGYEGVTKIIFKEQEFRKKLLVPYHNKKEFNDVRGLLVDNRNVLWAATKAGKLYIVKNGLGLSNPFIGNVQNAAGIYSIFQDSKNRIWFGTKADGLVKLENWNNKDAKVFTTQYTTRAKRNDAISSNSIYCVFEDHKGGLWAGSYGEGLIQINVSGEKTSFKTISNSFRKYPKEGFRKIRHIAEDSNGLIWVGTTDGLVIFDPDQGTPDQYVFRTYRKEIGNLNSLGGNDVQYLIRDSEDKMWVLTTTGGLNLASGVNPLDKLYFTNYSTRNGLPSDNLLSGVEDKRKNLWIATGNGLIKFNLPHRKWQVFNRNDGLGGVAFSEASCAKTQNGEIVFGTTAGLVSFNPEQIRTIKTSANLAFTNLQVNSKDVIPGQDSPLKFSINNTDELKLDHDQNVISIDFAVLDFHSTENQNYSYRLVGFDNVWRSSAGQRRATYTKLPPGSYTFEVKSLNEELYSNVPSKSLKIIIAPPFWLTWWAYLVYAFLIVIAVLLMRRVILTVLALRQTIVIEKRLAELKLNFFTQISHELRTPLTLIINPIEEIQKHESLSRKGIEYVDVVVRNAHRMLRLVNQVLDLRKVQSGTVVINREAVDILPFIETIIEYFRETLQNRNISIKVPENCPRIVGFIDRDKIEIVIYNLLANAIKFSNNNSLIVIEVSQSEDSKNFTVEVIDQGPGVEDTELKDIFQLYYKGKQKTEHQAKGTGIGLALSKELVELHQGVICASNHNGKGLKVAFTLPLISPGNINAGQDRQRVNSSDREAPSLPTAFQGANEPTEVSSASLPSVLIVEDNDELRRFLTTKFSDIYLVETAANGVEGLQKARELAPDLILSDVMMPAMDGIQMLNELKQDSLTSHIPVILLTAKHSVKSQLQGLKYGADYYITKPFKTELLEGALEAIISRRRSFLTTLLKEEPVDKGTQEPSPAFDQEPAEVNVIMTDVDRAFIERVLANVEEKLSDSQFNIDDVVDTVNMSRSTFYRKLKSLTGLTPVEFVREVRLKKVKDLFDAGEDNVSTAAYSVGFANPKYLTYCFKNRYNRNPSDYIKSVNKRKSKE